MKTNIIFFILSLFIFSYQNLYADSPLTSTEISKAYEDLEIVKSALNSEGEITTEIMDYLSDSDNPTDVKIAAINALSWDIGGKSNSDIFFDYLKKKYNYKITGDFIQKGNSSDLICMAYLKALDNYFDVDEAILFAQAAKLKNNKSYTINIITALIEAQKAMAYDWCHVFKLTDNVRSDNSLIMDMNKNAIDIIFEYMDLYEDEC